MAEAKIVETLAFLKALKERRGPDPAFAAKQKSLVESCLSEVERLSPAAATKLLALASDLPEDLLTVFTQAVEDKVAAHSLGPAEKEKSTGSKMQKNLHIHSYFTDVEWKTLLNMEHCWDQKQMVIAKRFALLGMTSPTEHTSVMAIAMLLTVCHDDKAGPLEALRINANEALSWLTDFKAVLKNQVKFEEHSGVLHYPANPGSLPQGLFARAYPTNRPMACQASADTITSLVLALPARKTHGTVAKSKKAFHVQSKDLAVKEMLADMCFRQMMEQYGGSGQIPLTILQKQKPKQKALLGAAGPEPPHSSCREPASLPLEDRPRADAEVASGQQQTKPVAAVPEAEPGLDNDARAAAEKKVSAIADLIGDQLSANKTPKRKHEQEVEEPLSAEKVSTKGKAPRKAAASPKAEKVSPKGKAPRKAAASPKPACKSKAAAKAVAKATGKGEGILKCPGISATAPVKTGVWTVYTCPKSQNWRVKREGERKDKAFSWKGCATAAAWQKVVAFLQDN